jgi:hypothetical protein
MSRLKNPRVLGLACAAVGALAASGALGQRFDSKHGRTLVVGPSRGPTPTDRVDARRSGFARERLPAGRLRIAWRRSIGQSLEHAPLVTEQGAVIAFGGRGDVVVLDSEGVERDRMTVGVGGLGPGAILSDGTVVTVNAAGEVVGLRDGVVRFRTRVGDRGVVVRVAPVALDDGGVAVANGAELATLDAEGGLRARAALVEPASEVLTSQILATTTSPSGPCLLLVDSGGTVYTWMPGREPSRAGSLGGSADGGAALADEHTLLAVIDSTRLVALDLDHGALVTRATTSAGWLLGPPALLGRTAFVELIVPGAVLSLGIDPQGRELSRTSLSTYAPAALADGGSTPMLAATRTATLVDATGTLAFATPDGHVGIRSTGGVDSLGELVCGRGATPQTSSVPNAPPGLIVQSGGAPRPSAGFAGLAPAGAGAFLIACENGTILKIVEDKS